jgi:hypothetical protein
MSSDIFLQCFRDREPATFERAVFEEIFGRGAVNPQFPLTDVAYPAAAAARSTAARTITFKA